MDRLSVAYQRDSFPIRDPRRTHSIADGGAMRSLQQDILRTLIYFDMFDHPLRLAEIHQFLPAQTVTREELHLQCLIMLLNRHVEEKDGYFSLVGRSAKLADARIRKERHARRMWMIARMISGIVRRFPFVRGVFVSGELSKGVASKGSDIDFFIVTAPQRVWIVRTLCTVFKVLFLFDRKKFFCYNHIASEEQLEIEDRSVYTAVECVTLRPTFNESLYERFREANSWTKEFLPNAPNPAGRDGDVPAEVPFVERLIVALVPSQTLDTLDIRFLNFWRSVWGRRYPGLTEEKRARLFQCRPQLSTAYARDFFERISLQYHRRLTQFGLDAVR